MTEIAVVSGKGGTGKTTVTAALTRLAAGHPGPDGSSVTTPRTVVAADADVDAANLSLLLPGDDLSSEPFYAGERAVVDAARCDGCGQCVDACAFSALSLSGDGQAQVDTLSCEGCRVCRTVCPQDAVTMHPNRAGRLMVRQLHGKDAPRCLVHAELGVAQDNSGKLVAAVRARARAEAARLGADLVLIDGPPGIGCPVHAAITGVRLILAVTEPTPSGAHDLTRLLELARTFGLAAAVVVNKADLSPTYTRTIEQLARGFDAPVVGTLPFDPAIVRRLALNRIPLDLPAWTGAVVNMWQRVRDLVDLGAAQQP